MLQERSIGLKLCAIYLFRYFDITDLNLQSTETLETCCRIILLKDCNVANSLRNIATPLLQNYRNIKMSAFRKIAIKYYNYVAI